MPRISRRAPAVAEHLRRSPDLAFVTPAQLAERLDTSVTALKRQRCAGGGPKFIRHGRGVLYHTASVLESEERQLRSTSAT